MIKKRNILLPIFGILLFVVMVFASGFLFLDKIIIPKYFGEYGINGLKDLVNIISSLYSVPDENDLVTNGYSQEDLNSGVQKLQAAGYKIEDDGTILAENAESFKGDGKVLLTDREFASICNQIMQTELLKDVLDDLNYINLINISLIDLVVTPNPEYFDAETDSYTRANLRFIIIINTVDLRTQIAMQMQTSEALLKIIIPSKLYFTVDYDIDISANPEFEASGSIAINGKTERQSDALINLLIDFIFSPEDGMDKNEFTLELGDIILQAIDKLGEFSFVKNIENTGSNGFLIG